MSRTSDKSSKYFPIRRSTRLPLELPVHVSSADPKVNFNEDCSTVTVSAHGCGVISARQLPQGTRVQLEIVADKQSTSARILEVVPLNDDNTSWLLGMELERPGNFWGIKYAPADWAEEEGEPEAPVPVEPKPDATSTPNPATVPGQTSPAAASSKPEAQSRPHFHVRPVAKNPAPQPAPVASVAPPQPTAPRENAPPKAAAATSKEVPEAVLRRLLSECRLAAISVGACYVQTGTTFPLHAPVKLVVQAAGKDHSFHGTVRVEHVGAGMGLEFSGSGDEHANRIAELIEALSAHGDKIPQVRVELAAPDKNNPPKSKSASAAAAQYDSLLGLVLVGSSLKRSDFLHELETQRRKS
jgi:hypothetical protein